MNITLFVHFYVRVIRLDLMILLTVSQLVLTIVF